MGKRKPRNVRKHSTASHSPEQRIISYEELELGARLEGADEIDSDPRDFDELLELIRRIDKNTKEKHYLRHIGIHIVSSIIVGGSVLLYTTTTERIVPKIREHIIEQSQPKPASLPRPKASHRQTRHSKI